jgi:hypothetical protein
MTSLVIVGRRWFDRVNGNTYHSAEMVIDGECVGKVPMTYGYGDQYIDSAFDYLEKKNLIPLRERYITGSKEQPYQWVERTGIKVFSTASEVRSKKDL